MIIVGKERSNKIMKMKKIIGLAIVAGAAGVGLATTADAAITSDVKELDVEIKYGRQEVEFEYEVKNARYIQAKYKNELTGEYLSGRAAQTKIEALMANVDIKTDSREKIAQTVASQVSQQAYTKFGFETEFTNRRKIEFKLTNTVTPTPPTTSSQLTDFEVEIKYGRSEIEIDYEVKRGFVKAKYKNDLTREYLAGAKAIEKIEGLMSGMEFRGASRNDIVSYILRELDLGTNYAKFDFEAKYADRAKVEFEYKNR